MAEQLSREELFLLVCEKPAEEVARYLGISGAVLANRCKKLQVPQPPAGYWAKIRTGKQPKKPLLREFSELLIDRQKERAGKHRVKRGSLPLTPLQAEIFQRAVEELTEADVDLGQMEITRSGV